MEITYEGSAENETRSVRMVQDEGEDMEMDEEQGERRVMEVEEEERIQPFQYRRVLMIEGQTSEGEKRVQPFVLKHPPLRERKEEVEAQRESSGNDESIIDIESEDEEDEVFDYKKDAVYEARRKKEVQRMKNKIRV